MPDSPLTLPWSRTLAAVTVELDRGGQAIIRSHETNAKQWRSALRTGLYGESFVSARRSEERMADRQRLTATLIAEAAKILSGVASAQAQLEAEYEAIIERARSRNLREVAGRFIAATDAQLEEAALFNAAVAEIRRHSNLLDRHCGMRLMTLLPPRTPWHMDRRRCREILTDLYAPSTAQRPLPASLDVSAAELHETNIRNAGPDLTGLAERFPEMHVLEVGEHHLVAAFGDIDNAKSILTMVSGVGSAEPEALPGILERGQALQRELGETVVVWNGYRAPGHLVDGTQEVSAELGAVALRDFQRSLTLRYGPSVARTVLGHSYGSVVVGLAAAKDHGGIDADGIVLLGSPGAGVSHVDELQLNSPNPRVIAARSPTDPISLVSSADRGLHGPDPAAPDFGAEVIPAHGGHSDYLDDPSVLAALRGLHTR
ncbi:alpha/beta hydrolase [Corynebacterium sp. CCM 9203]|uniref:alpha/beta hydrolase n=1 Tax=Corynebacterium sp. CCM 9203 TaxID=3057615 RepID=UPI0035264C9B